MSDPAEQLNHHVQIAKIKAEITRALNANPEKMSVKELTDVMHNMLTEFSYSESNLRSLLSTMSSNGLIKETREGSKVFYQQMDESKRSQERSSHLSVVSNERIQHTEPNEFIFDISRQSGNLKITHSGLVEEFRLKGPLTFNVGDKKIVLKLN